MSITKQWLFLLEKSQFITYIYHMGDFVGIKLLTVGHLLLCTKYWHTRLDGEEHYCAFHLPQNNITIGMHNLHSNDIAMVTFD